MMVRQTRRRRFGGVDILVNNAGIQHVAPIEEFPAGEVGRDPGDQPVGRVPRHPGGAARDEGRAAGAGSINVASAHGLVASPFKAAYVAAKHGMVGLTKVTALEAAEDGITCNAVCPGYVWTPLVEKQIDDQARSHGIAARAGDPRRAAEEPAQQALRRRSPSWRR